MGAKILHLSDIHFNGASESETDPDAIYRDELVKKIRASAAEGAFDAIFVTGDIANWGLKSEYDIARIWLAEIARISGVSDQGVYLVPGNHDVDRSISSRHALLKIVQKTVVGQGSAADRERELKTVMTDEAMGPALFRPLEAYNNFAAEYQSEVGPKEYGRWVRWLALDYGYWLKIFGLNSVLFSSCRPPGGDDDPRQNLYVGPFQSTFRTKESEIGVVLIHHPPHWLLDHDEQVHLLKDRVPLQFMGHVHDRDVDRNSDFMRFGAGAVSPNRHEPAFEPGFNVVHLEVRKDGEVATLVVSAEVWAWQASPGRFRRHETKTGDTRWDASFPLPPIPQEMEPMTGAERAPPPAPESGGAHGRDVQRFWALSSSNKRIIAESLGLLNEDEARLPERYRYANIFKRAVSDEKLPKLIEMIHMAEGE